MLEVYMRAMLLKILMVMLAAALIVPPMTLAQAQGDSPSGFFLYSLTNGAQLFVDGQERGVVPVEGLVPLSPGQHTIKLMRRARELLVQLHLDLLVSNQLQLAAAAASLVVGLEVEHAHAGGRSRQRTASEHHCGPGCMRNAAGFRASSSDKSTALSSAPPHASSLPTPRPLFARGHVMFKCLPAAKGCHSFK